MIYYVAAVPGTGAGTLASPYGLGDLPAPGVYPYVSVAFDNLVAGDTLYFRGGDYHFTGSLAGGVDTVAILYPGASGTAAAPITIASYPGELARLFSDGGSVSPLLGSGRFTTYRDYIRLIGLEVHCGPNAGLYMKGDYNEVAYCHTFGIDLGSATDNHPAIAPNGAYGWVHHNEIEGQRGGGTNNAGALSFFGTFNVVEWNYFHGNTNSLYWKGHADDNVFRYNLCVGGDQETSYKANGKRNVIHDCILDAILTHGRYAPTTQDESINAEIRNNLFLQSGLPSTSQQYTIIVDDEAHLARYYNNIFLIASSGQFYAHTNLKMNYSVGLSTSPIEYYDYNLYTKVGGVPVPAYYFGLDPTSSNTRTLAQMQADGWEVHSQFLSGGPATIFSDTTNYVLKPAYQAAGRDGGKPGPADPASILAIPGLVGPAAWNGVPSFDILSLADLLTPFVTAGPGNIVPNFDILSLADLLTPFGVAGPSGSTGAVTAYTLTGPSSGLVGVASGPFTVTLGAGVQATPVAITPSAGGVGGSFSPPNVLLTNTTRSATFTCTPASVGTVNVAVTDNASPSLTDPAPITYTASPTNPPATFVGSGPAGISLTAAESTIGTSPWTHRWQRTVHGASSWADLSDGGGVTGSATLSLLDGSAAAGTLYDYRLKYTDAASAITFSTAVPASGAQLYLGGPIGGGEAFESQASDFDGGF